jgi:hypothetical protein
MLWATAHGKRLVTGASIFVPPGLRELSAAEEAPDPRALATVLRSIYPLRYAVVHLDRLQPPQWERWAARLADPPPGLAFVERVGAAAVWVVAGTPEAGVDLRRYVSSDYLRRHPVAAWALALPDTDGQVRRWMEVTFNGRPLEEGGEGPHAIRLPEPYREADRNELRFTHNYAVRSDIVTADPSYRVGETGVSAPVDIEVISFGHSPGDARIRVNGRDVPLTLLRGYNVVALEPRAGTLLWAESFDTFRGHSESRRMARWIEPLPAGTLVIAAVKTDGGGQLELEGLRALRSVGGMVDLRETLFVSHALVGIKGARPGKALEVSGQGELTIRVGRERRLRLVLERFELRSTERGAPAPHSGGTPAAPG